MTTETTAIHLAVDPGRPAAPILVGRFLRTEIRSGLSRLSRTLGIRQLHAAVPEDWAIPDSDFAVGAIEVASTLCPQFMMRHCFRSYCFGAILAARHALALDREVFFVAAMLHDLGLSDLHADDAGSFEYVGARLAHAYVIDAGRDERIAATVHNAVALHTSVGVADRFSPEVALLHFGTGLDLFGMRLDEISEESLHSVLKDYPRGAFKEEFSPCLRHQAEAKPDSQIAGAVRIGIIDRIRDSLT